ncbi:MAG: hypothetical protein K6G60_03140 [Lachnospiraceae bacterium]|nr:hypothetical protein [Lachnospiraceae bacterium]
MYKAQMKFQKIICLGSLIASFIVFLYSLGIMTDMYDCFYSTMMNPDDLSDTWVPGSIIYYDMQPFNYKLTTIGILLILASLTLFVTSTQKRRRYYIGNIITVTLNILAGIASTVYCLPRINAFKIQFLTTVDFEALKFFAELFDGTYTESTFWFDLGYSVFGLLLLTDALLLGNLICKLVMMKKERQLIDQGKEER